MYSIKESYYGTYPESCLRTGCRFDTKIRAMAAAAEANGSASEEWLAWARAKADWYDPTVAATDEFFGKRKHEESEDKKTLREKGSYHSYW